MSLRQQQGRMRTAANTRHGEAPLPHNPLLHFRHRDGTHKVFEACIDELRMRQKGGRRPLFLFFEKTFVVGGKQRV